MLTQEEAARLRIKARHGELTPEEQLMYSEYMESDERKRAEATAGAVQVAQPVQTAAPNPEDTGSFGWAVLGFFLPIVGLILYLVWKTDKPLSAKRAGKGALVSVIVGVALMLLWIILAVVLLGSMAGGASVHYYSSYSTMLLGL